MICDLRYANSLIDNQGLDILVVSYGGSCSNLLVDTLEKNSYKCKCKIWDKILCHCPVYIKTKIPVIYIYDNPIKAFLSMKNRGKDYWDTNQKKLSNNKNIKLSDENLLELMFHQFYSWIRESNKNMLVIKSLELLNVGGILSFVLPLNFLNCLYYDKTRAYISKYFKIISITYCNDKYIETEQETLLFIIEKIDIAQENIDVIDNNNNDEYIIRIKEYTIFGVKENIKILKSLYEESYSLADIGFKVNVGSVVWNQCKDILTDDKRETRLIYSGDIKNNKLIYKKYADEKKKNHILKKGIKEPLLIINRGYGVGNYKFEYCLISSNYYDNCEEYLIENHLICIRYRESIDKDALIGKYEKIINSLNDNRTQEFIKLYFGNNAINTTELNYILPIYHEEYS